MFLTWPDLPWTFLTGKFYDPLAWVSLSPVTILLKILFQKLCQDKCDWDEVILRRADREMEGPDLWSERSSADLVPEELSS